MDSFDTKPLNGRYNLSFSERIEYFLHSRLLEDIAFPLALAEGFGRGSLCPLGKKRGFYTLLVFLGNLMCSVVTAATLSSNIRDDFN